MTFRPHFRRGRFLCLDDQRAEAEFGIDMMSFSNGLASMKSSEPSE